MNYRVPLGRHMRNGSPGWLSEELGGWQKEVSTIYLFNLKHVNVLTILKTNKI